MLRVWRRERRCRMESRVAVVLLLACSLTPVPALYSGPLQPELSNGTFHHFFVPDGDYDATEDPEDCQMLFKFSDVVSPCFGADEDGDAAVRDDFMLGKLQVEEAARLLEGVGRAVSLDLDGEDSYGTLLRREAAQVGEAFSGVDRSLQELEAKFKESQETELREERQLSGHMVGRMAEIRAALRETADIHLGLRDRHELLSLVVRSHGTRLNRLKTEYLLHTGS